MQFYTVFIFFLIVAKGNENLGEAQNMFGLLEDVDLQDGSIPSVQRPLYKFIKEDHFKLYIFFPFLSPLFMSEQVHKYNHTYIYTSKYICDVVCLVQSGPGMSDMC